MEMKRLIQSLAMLNKSHTNKKWIHEKDKLINGRKIGNEGEIKDNP